jgi:hypothetical protein
MNPNDMQPCPFCQSDLFAPLGQVAYEAYCKHFGCAIAPYKELPHKIKASLEVGINAALIVYLERLKNSLLHNHYANPTPIVPCIPRADGAGK